MISSTTMKSKGLYPSESDLHALFTFRMRWGYKLLEDIGLCSGDGLEGTDPAITATPAKGHGDSPRDSSQEQGLPSGKDTALLPAGNNPAPASPAKSRP